jgi:hypothetical protein
LVTYFFARTDDVTNSRLFSRETANMTTRE